MGCREFFEAHAEDLQRCKTLQQQSLETQLEWEAETASSHSPGPIKNDETLIRYWLNPVHYDRQTGTLKATAFDDASNKGLSVNRLNHVSLEDIRDTAQVRVEAWIQANPDKIPRELIGYSDFSAGEARSVQVVEPPPSRRAFAVYDTANLQDKSHADVCQIVSTTQGGRSARSQMRQLTNERLKRF